MKKFFILSLSLLLLAVITLAAIIPAVNLALTNEALRNILLDKIAASLGGEMEANFLSITLDKKNINIKCNGLKGELLDSSLTFDLQYGVAQKAYIDLLHGSFFPDIFQLTSPHISYIPGALSSPAKSAKVNWGRKFNAMLEEMLGRGTRIAVTDGSLTLASTSFSKIYISTTSDNPFTTLSLRTDIEHNGSIIPLNITGTTTTPLTGRFSYELAVEADSVPLALIPASQNFYFSGGTADFTGKLEGSGRDITMDAVMDIYNLDMNVGWTSEDKTIHQEKQYRIEYSSLAVKGAFKGKKIDVQDLTLMSDDFKLQGSLILDFSNLVNPFMDLRLKSNEMKFSTLKMLLPDPLISDWATQTIFPGIKNGTARMTAFTLAGTVDDIGKPGSDYLSWSGVLRNIDTFYYDDKPLARIHSANLSMDGDLLKITEISGESGKSTLTKGNLTISGLYDPTSILTTDVKGSFSLPWITTLARTGILGKPLMQMVSPVSSIFGMFVGSIDLSMTLADELILHTLKGKGSASPMELGFRNMIFPLKMKKADFSLNYPGISIINGKGSWGKSTFDGSMNLVELYKKQQFKLNIRPNLAELKENLTTNQVIRSLAPCIASLPVQANITLENKTISSSGSLDFSKSVSTDDNELCKQIFAENHLLRADYNFNSSGKNLTIDTIDLHTMDGNMQVTGFLKNYAQTPLLFKNLKLQAADFPVQSLNLIIPSATDWFNGSLTANFVALNCSQDNIWQTITGKLQLKGWKGLFVDSPLTVNNLDISATAENGHIKIKGTNVLLADFCSYSPLTLQADLKKEVVWDGTVLLYGKNVDLTPTYRLFEGEKNLINYSLPVGKIRFVAGIDNVRYRNLTLSPLLMESIITADTIFTSKLLLQLSNDFLWLTGTRQDNDVIYTSYFKILKKPVDTFMALLGLENEITGDLDIEGKITARLTPEKNILETTSGPIYFEIEDGTIESSSTLIKILDLISLENIFDKQDILRWKNVFNYTQIAGRFDLDNGILTTNSLIMDASSFDLFSEGSIDLLQETVDMRVKLAPFGTINKLFSSIPYLGYVLTGKTKSMFDYTFSVIGKIGNPEVEYTPLAGTVQSLTGYIKRLVTNRKEVKENINTHLKVDMARKRSFILRTSKELLPLQSVQ